MSDDHEVKYYLRTQRHEDGLYVLVDDLTTMLRARAEVAPDTATKVEYLIVLAMLRDLQLQMLERRLDVLGEVT